MPNKRSELGNATRGKRYEGELPKRCAATANRSGEPCKLPPISGGTVCQKHGGSAPQVKAAAAKRLGELSADRNMNAKFVIRKRATLDPLDAMREVALDTLAIKDILQDRVAELSSVRYQSAEGAEQIRGEIQVYLTLLKQAHQTLNDMSKLALDERRVAIQAAQARMVIAAVVEGLKDAGVSGEQMNRARTAIANRLRVLK